MMEIAKLCISMGVDGHRADIVTLKTANTLCAHDDISRAAEMALPTGSVASPLKTSRTPP